MMKNIFFAGSILLMFGVIYFNLPMLDKNTSCACIQNDIGDLHRGIITSIKMDTESSSTLLKDQEIQKVIDLYNSEMRFEVEGVENVELADSGVQKYPTLTIKFNQLKMVGSLRIQRIESSDRPNLCLVIYNGKKYWTDNPNLYQYLVKNTKR